LSIRKYSCSAPTGREDLDHVALAEQFQDAERLLAERVHRLQEGNFLVERFTRPRQERRRMTSVAPLG